MTAAAQRVGWRVAAVLVPFGVGVLELSHPAWGDGSVAQAVVASGDWWIPLHLLLIAGYGLLVRCLWTPPRLTRCLLVAFVATNTAFLALDGIGVGLLARSDPAAADALWNGPPVVALADATGAAWAAALLATAATLYPRLRGRLVLAGLGLTWLSFVASSVVPSAALAARALAIATGAWAVYSSGSASVPFALLVFAAPLRQHVGAEAAFGMLCIGLALALRGRSAPAAACQP